MANLLLEIKGIDVSYGQAQVLFDVNLGASEGAILGILGANGAGKSTLLKTISGLIRPQKGEIFFDGIPIHKLPPQEIVPLGISLVPEGRRIFTNLTVEENLKLGAFSTRARSNLKETIEMVYEFFPILRQKRNQRAGTLSGGQQQMLAIARSLMAKPKLMLLDEPSLGLSPLVVKNIFDIIYQLNNHNVTVLLVEQNVHQVLKIVSDVYVLKNGKVVIQEKATRLKEKEELIKAYIA